jgi:transcriptional regulator with XRE-family HTH domain
MQRPQLTTAEALALLSIKELPHRLTNMLASLHFANWSKHNGGMPKLPPISVHDLGDYLREQRQSAQLSLRQLSEVAGISNPYISQVERGLKKPSAEILQALAKALRISAESLYVRAGILDARTDDAGAGPVDVTDAVLADPRLNDRQRAVLLDVYVSFVGEPAAGKSSASRSTKTTTPAKAPHAPSPSPKPGTPAHPKTTQKEKQS